MAPTKSLFGAALAVAAALPAQVLAHSEEDYANMGPMGFFWPDDREFADDETSMTGPCGSSGGAVNRTEFPLVNGALALEQKQEIHDLRISVAFDNDPSNDTTFEVLIPEDRIRFLEYSHVCIDIPDMPSGGEAGQNATIQLRYTAEYMDPNHEHKRHLPVNETFYSCADVTLVSQSAFTYDDIPCFNATADWDDDTTGHHVQEHEHEHEHDHGSDHDHEHDHGSDESSDDDDDSDSSSGSSGLSGGDIAGIVIGSVVGVAVIATAAWYFIRRDRREKQLAQHMAANAEKSGAQSMSQSTS